MPFHSYPGEVDREGEREMEGGKKGKGEREREEGKEGI